MRLRKAELSNFGSYQHLYFDFQRLGLSLINGSTGSGKSTLQDAPLWILFGITSRNGSVDDVKGWYSQDKITRGIIGLEINNTIISVTRIRGKSSENDLYWQEGGSSEKHRGKDLTDTQRLLDARLGVNAELFLIGAYYNEFSRTGQFFTNSAKERRNLFEKIADLELASTVYENSSDFKKTLKKQIVQLTLEQHKLEGKVEEIDRTLRTASKQRYRWEEERLETVLKLESESLNFDTLRQSRIEALTTKAEAFELNRIRTIDSLKKKHQKKLENFVFQKSCPSCGALRHSDETELLELDNDFKFSISKEENAVNPHLSLIEMEKQSYNPLVKQIETEKSRINPYIWSEETNNKLLLTNNKKLHSIKEELEALNKKFKTLEQLQDLTHNLRAVLLNKTIKNIETKTNFYLETYFDSEIRVSFETNDSDSLNVTIHKNGYDAPFTRLSKGQTGLLKLCFGLSVMEAASNKAGIHFQTLFLDEALDGMDNDLKLKAFSLLSKLEKNHETVLVIDHSQEIKSLFGRSFMVELRSDMSVIEEQ